MNTFNPEQTEENFSANALAMARAANLAYEDEAAVEKQVTKWGFEKFKFFDENGTQAFIAGSEKIILVAFRGTEPTKVKDLFTDAKLFKAPGPAGRVHFGFLQALEEIMEGVHWKIQEFKKIFIERLGDDLDKPPPSLWFTGHSLGAGLATLAVAKLRIEKDHLEEPVHGLFTFGSPRVGDKEFAEKFSANFEDHTYRFVHNNDVVTRVPLRAHSYRHVGRFWYLSVKGDLLNDPGWWKLKLDRVKGRIEDLGKIGPDGLKDHSMKHYISKLEGV